MQVPYSIAPLLFLLYAGGVCVFSQNPSLPLINFHLKVSLSGHGLRWYLPLGVKISPSGVMVRVLWGSFTSISCHSSGVQPQEALRPPPSCPGRTNQPGGRQQNRNAALWPAPDRASLRGPHLLQAMALPGKPGIRSLIPPRNPVFLSLTQIALRKGPSSN